MSDRDRDPAEGLQAYLVGGAVRDLLLGRAAKDADYVVVGETPQTMTERGFAQVGKDFPVFLHPVSKDEYALARTERKTGVGYTGFETRTQGVSLKDDLRRRDLTINAMALAPDGSVIDPYGGQEDLAQGVLRHVDDEAFAEDPLRVLRVARFHARYGFQLDPRTVELAHRIVASGEMEALPAERLGLETTKALGEDDAAAYFEALDRVGALTVVLPEVVGADLDPLRAACEATGDPLTRFAALASVLSPAESAAVVGRLRLSNDYRTAAADASMVAATPLVDVDAVGALRLLRELGAPHPQGRPRVARAAEVLEAQGRGDEAQTLRGLSAALYAVNTAAVAQAALRAGKRGKEVGDAVQQAQVEALQVALP